MTNASLISRTGRVQNWIDNPDGRLPVSCTVFVVEDSMEGPNGIEASWRFVSHALRFGAGVAVHLSKLRPKGSENEKGLVASGPVSFAKIYSALNETLRRGGVWKLGAVVAHCDLDHADIIDFITTPRSELTWIKRCVDIDNASWRNANKATKDALLHGIKSGDIWLNKIKYDKHGNRIYGNVCLEVYLQSRGTCLLSHVNLSACRITDLPKGFAQGMSSLCELHSRTGVAESGEYLPPDTDKQVGLGMLGLANFLRQNKVSYADFADALENNTDNQTALQIVWSLEEAIEGAAYIARHANMERAFAIAPTASCSYRSKDLEGFTTTPEIAPPIGRTVDRDSGTFGVERYEYGDVEIASEVGWDVYKRVADGIMRILDKTGLLHGYSFNSWSDACTYNREFIEEWLASPQTSLYYSLQVMGDVQDKSSAYAALDEEDVENYLEGLLANKPDTIPINCDCQE